MPARSGSGAAASGAHLVSRLRWLGLVLATLSPGSCSSSVAAPAGDGGPADAARGDAGAGLDAAPSDGGGASVDAGDPSAQDAAPFRDASPPPEPRPVAPCDAASCWSTSLPAPRCLARGQDEDFSSGRYSVHAWASSLWAGADTTVELDRTGGTWQPALLVVDAGDGTVLSDGTTGRVDGGSTVSIALDGRAGATASLLLRSDRDRSIVVYVTSWAVVDSGFAAAMPADATYHLSIASACEGTVTVECVVNGHGVDEPACGWLHHIARTVVPLLAGSRDDALTAAARVAWWSLKEGVLFLDNPIVYSSCNTASGDRRIGPLEVCEPGRAWQVGMSGVQVPGRTVGALESTAASLFPARTIAAVLDETAREAGVDDATRAAIVASTGALRSSWLLRTTAIGFTYQAVTVTDECVDRSLGWCSGTGWTTTRLYAPDPASSLRAIDDVRAILAAVAP